METNNATTLSGGRFSANFSGTFFSVGPPAAGNGDSEVFWPFLGVWHLEKFRAWAENTKTQFPGGGGTFGGKVPLGDLTARKFLLEIPQLFYS